MFFFRSKSVEEIRQYCNHYTVSEFFQGFSAPANFSVQRLFNV